MNLFLGLHGAVALVVLCSLLLVEEAGVPLPVPGEITLIAAGLLIGTGAVDPWLFVPLAIVSCLSGAMTGYSWARLVGEHGLAAAAEKLHQKRRMDRVKTRLRRATPLEIALTRMVPLLRVNTTLVAGAAGIDRWRFLIGITPVTVLWVLIFTALGALVGAPAAHYLSELAALIPQGGILIVIGVGGYIAIRRVPAGGRAVLGRLPTGLRMVLALAVDLALIVTVVAGVLSIVAGVLAMVRPLSALEDLVGWVELGVTVAVIAVFYSLATRRGLTATAGETLFEASYLTDRAGGSGYARLRRLLGAEPELEGEAPSAELARTAAIFRLLADQRHLRVAYLLLEKDYDLSELASELGWPSNDVSGILRDLEDGGLVIAVGEREVRYSLASELVSGGLSRLMAEGARSSSE